MKNISILFSMLLLISACSQNETLTIAPENMNQEVIAQSAKKPSIIKGKVTYDSRSDAKVKKNYTFNKPTATYYADLYISDYTPAFINYVKEFMANYVSNQDIERYEIIVKDSDKDIVNVNFYGGQDKFLKEKLIPDLNFYVGQRTKFDHRSMKLEAETSWTTL